MTFRATVLTLYPEMFPGPLGASPAGRALSEGRWSLDAVQIRDFDTDAALAYAALPFRRTSYGWLIAAHALSRGLIVVTDNEAHFVDVQRLRTEKLDGVRCRCW